MSVQLIFRSPEGERIVVLDRPLVVGRDAACDVPIATVRLSRRHAEFEAGPEGVKVRDLGSKNGDPGERRRRSRKRVLKPGDRVLLGDVSVSVERPGGPAAPRVAQPGAGRRARRRAVPVPAAPRDLDRTARSARGRGAPAAPAPAPAGACPAAAARSERRARRRPARAGAVRGRGRRVAVDVRRRASGPPSVAAGVTAARGERPTRATTVVRLLRGRQPDAARLGPAAGRRRRVGDGASRGFAPR